MFDSVSPLSLTFSSQPAVKSCFSCDGDYLASGSHDRSVYVWHVGDLSSGSSSLASSCSPLSGVSASFRNAPLLCPRPLSRSVSNTASCQELERMLVAACCSTANCRFGARLIFIHSSIHPSMLPFLLSPSFPPFSPSSLLSHISVFCFGCNAVVCLCSLQLSTLDLSVNLCDPHPFIPSFIHSFLLLSFLPSFLHPSIHPFLPSFIHSFFLSFTLSFLQLSTLSLSFFLPFFLRSFLPPSFLP